MTHLAKHVFFPRTCLNVLIWFKYFIPLTCLNVSVQYRKQIYRLHCNTSHFGLSHDKWRENFKIFEIEKRMNRTTHTFGIGRNGDLILDRCCPQYPVKRPSLPFPEIWKKNWKKFELCEMLDSLVPFSSRKLSISVKNLTKITIFDHI